jgi:hypothetical protein
VTAHASGHLLRWDAAGARAGESTETGTITSIAIDPASGRIAVGRLLFEDQGGGLLCAARGGAVQRLTV